MALFLHFTFRVGSHTLLLVRIHWSIALFTSLAVIALTWHLRTRHLDFMTPRGITLPPEDFGDDLATGVPILQPQLAPAPEILLPLDSPPEEPEVAPITPEDLGDLESSPGLDAYQEFAREELPDRLLELSALLRTQGQFQRALLALERVVDTSEATSEELREAGQGIAALESTLSPWNVDSSETWSLNLNVNTSGTASAELKNAALEIATIINQHSGQQLSIAPKISQGDEAEGSNSRPITIWFSTPGDDPKSSPVLSITPPEDSSQLADKVILMTYQAIRNTLEKSGFPPPPALDEPPKFLLATQVSRLMWREFALTLYPEPKKASPPSREAIEPE